MHSPSMFSVKVKIYGVLYNQSSSISFDETSSIDQRQKALNFSAFHWSPHGSLISIGQYFITTRVVHLPKRTETSSITESDRTDPITESHKAVRAVQSWLNFLCLLYLKCFQIASRTTNSAGLDQIARRSSLVRIFTDYSGTSALLQLNFNGSNTDGSFTITVSNSALSPLEKAQSCRFGII